MTTRFDLVGPFGRIVPIPIRADLVVHIAGMPDDMTKVEAEKIARVVMAFSTEKAQEDDDKIG